MSAAEMTSEMLCVIARRVFRRRDAGLDGLDLSDTPLQLTPEQTLEVLEEAERRGLIEVASERR